MSQKLNAKIRRKVKKIKTFKKSLPTISWSHRVEAMSTVIIAIATVVNVVVAIWQRNTTENIFQQQEERSYLENRAYLSGPVYVRPNNIDPQKRVGYKHKIEVELTNAGKTPATSIKVTYQFFINGLYEAEAPTSYTTQGFLGPGQTMFEAVAVTDETFTSLSKDTKNRVFLKTYYSDYAEVQHVFVSEAKIMKLDEQYFLVVDNQSEMQK